MGRPKVIDEFTNLPVTKQRKYQLRCRRDGFCEECGLPNDRKPLRECSRCLGRNTKYKGESAKRIRFLRERIARETKRLNIMIRRVENPA